jgi:hypothetical protein
MESAMEDARDDAPVVSKCWQMPQALRLVVESTGRVHLNNTLYKDHTLLLPK